MERNAAFYETAGYNSYRLGLNSFDCPFKPGDERNKQWLAGYNRAKAENAKPMQVGEKSKPRPRTTVTTDPTPRRPSQRIFQPRTKRGETRQAKAATRG